MKQGYGLLTIGYWLIAAVLMPGCAKDDEYATNSNPVTIEMAYAYSLPGSGGVTRQAPEVVTSETTNSRRPQSLRVIPLINNTPASIDYSFVESVLKSAAGNNSASLLYRTRYFEVVSDVNGFLVYGSVPNLTSSYNTKVYNGSLIETFPSSITLVSDVQDGISFSLDPIYKSDDHPATTGKPDGIPAGAQTLADCLTAIATTSDFHTSTDPTIKGFFDLFTNEGNHIPGSAANVKIWIEKFIASLQPTIEDNNTPADIKDILTAIKNAATTQMNSIGEITSSSYPRDIHLPDGAAVLKWNSNTEKFEPQISTTTIANINSIARFAYPAQLYYFINSDIKTSDNKIDFAALYSQVNTTSDKTAWTQVLENANFDKTSVSANTKAVALTEPVQYAVAQLRVKIKASNATLPDAATPTVNVPVGTENFPLKGIIVCGQRPVDYKFEPKGVEPGASSDANVLFIYDNQVEANCYLTNQSEWLLGCNTLVLQSLREEDVNIILEFENNSNQSFTCLDGIVYQGTRFYLIGKVDASLYNFPDPNVKSENRGQVFTKDYITTVNMTVSTLARAYNVPPNLLSPNLEIGVETTPEWEGVTPTVIRLE